jgi:stearoyl-CoA desaturase (delta-9 desaturase)
MFGSSIGLHRLFSHRQFETYRPIELLLAFVGTLTTYGPLLFWASSHQCHHKFTDTDKDPTSPSRGFWHSVLTWNLKKDCEKEIVLKSYPCIVIMRDTTLMWITKNFFLINYVFLILLIVIAGYEIAIGGYVLATLLERIRIGFFVNYLLHTSVIGSYKVSDSSNSINLVWLYPLTSGFSLHDKHHETPKNLSEKTRWFEIDLEYYICKLITKK